MPLRSTSVRRVATGLLALVAAGGGLALAAAPAQAAPATRYVATTGSDSNGCTDVHDPCATISYAVGQANAGDTVSILDKGPYHESVRVRISLTIVGQGSSGSGRTVIDGLDDDPSVFVDGVDTDSPVVVTLKDLAIDGNTGNSGVRVSAATAHLIAVSASNNDQNGLALDTDATATVVDSVLSHNRGSGVESQLGNNRDLAAASPDLTVSGSDLSDNEGYGIGLETTRAAVDHSTIDRNGDGGIDVYLGSSVDVGTTTFDANVGAGVWVDTAADRATVTASTVSDTVPYVGEGTYGGGGLQNYLGTLAVDRSTIVGNTGQGVGNFGGVTTVDNSTINGTKPSIDRFSSGGLVNETPEVPLVAVQPAVRKKPARSPARPAITAGASLTVTGSIVAEQYKSTVPDCSGVVTAAGYDLSSDAANSCGFTAAGHDQAQTNPLLGALADNGGPTKTEVLKKLSPAIDAIAAGAAGCVPSATDQRGVARPQPTGGKCDIGAVELAAKALAIHPDSLPHGTVGKGYSVTITATGGQYPTYTFAFVSGTLPPGLTFTGSGHVSGTPTKAGTFHFTVSVNDPVVKAYTIVIDDATGTNGNGTAPISATGVPVLSMSVVGGSTLLIGFALMIGAGLIGRRPGRHRVED